MPQAVIASGRLALLSALFLLPVTAARAQSGADPPASTYVDSVEVNQVSIEVQVSGRKGVRILDLAREEFEIFEDGRRMEITHFRAPAAAVARPLTSPQMPSARTPSPAPPAMAGAEPPRHLLIFVDTLRLGVRHRRDLVRELREALSREPDSVRVMLAAYDGRLRVINGFGTPTATVLESLDALERGRLITRGRITRKIDGLAATGAELDAAVTPEQLESARSLRSSEWAELEAFAESERHDILRTIGTLRQLVFSLGGLSGRKSLLYAGDNLTMAPASDLFAASGSAFGGASPGGPTSSGARRLDLYRHFKSLVQQANASGVSLYTLTPPSHQHIGGAGVGRIGGPGFHSSVRSEWEERIKEAVCLMSGSTGGLCQSGGSDFGLLIDGALEDLEAFYSLGYVPDRPRDDGYHRIEVRVKRRGLRTRHREGYFDRAPIARLRERLAAALWFEAEQDPLAMELEFEPQRPLERKGRFLVPIHVWAPATSFALLPSGESGPHVARGRLLLVAARPNGRLTATEELPVVFEVDPRRLAEAPGAGPVAGHRIELRLGRGSHKLAVGLWDEVARQGSFTSRTVIVGEPGER